MSCTADGGRFSVYVVRCGDGSLYTGIATDVARRLAEHVSGRGAKYLRGRRPLELFYHQPIGDRSLASRVERHVKRLPRCDKADTEVLALRIREFVSAARSEPAQ